jgi:hypothetical protein
MLPSPLTHSVPSSSTQLLSPPVIQAQLDRELDGSEEDDNTANYTNTTFDGLITASPMPLSDIPLPYGERQPEPDENQVLRVDVPSYVRASVWEPIYTQPEFDPDGENITYDDSSPDKTGEFSLLAER